MKENRGEVWERFSRIGANRSSPWMLTGDFNEVVDPSEKKGGNIRSEESCYEFRHMLNACGLWEIRHSGYQYSWFGMRNEVLV